MDAPRLGELARTYGFLSEDQLHRVLALQAREGTPLGEILVREGYVPETRLRRLLLAQRQLVGLDEVSGSLDPAEVAQRLEGASLEDFLGVQRELGAQELHLVAGTPAMVRLNGDLIDLTPAPLGSDECRALLDAVLDDATRAALGDGQEVDFVHARQAGGRFRVCVYQQSKGLAGIFRLIPETVPDYEELGLPAVLARVPRLRQGLVLITGPRASGKTTTLAALVERINNTRRRHVITLERPIEYVFESKSALIAQREVGRDVADFQGGLRSCLREDPDVIVIGELDDPERIATSLTAAETGHLVLGTLQTATAQRTLLRILDAYSGRRRNQVRGMLASLLRLVVCQQLVPGSEGGRLHLAKEVLVVNPAVAAMIREDRVHQIEQVMQTSREEGMLLLDDSLAELVREGRINIGEALARATEPKKVLALAGTESEA
jgi:twitching motility protein PilT